MAAIPNYNRYGFRARRADGKDMLMRVASMEERHHTNFNKYTSKLKDDLKFASDTPNSDKGYYQIAITVAVDGQSYTLSATPQAGQVGDKCKVLTLDSTGKRDTNPTPPDQSNGNCW